MPKKTKRQPRRITVAEPGSPSASFTATGRAMDREFNPDYSVIIRDLRRIAILAGSFLVILIALAFILPLVLP